MGLKTRQLVFECATIAVLIALGIVAHFFGAEPRGMFVVAGILASISIGSYVKQLL